MRFFLAIISLTLAGTRVWAHDENLSRSRIDVHADGITWTVDLAMVGLEKVLKLPADPIDLTDRQFQQLKVEMDGYLRRCVKVEINGTGVDPEPVFVEPVYETFVASGEKYIAHARLGFSFRSPGGVRTARLSGAFFATITARHNALLLVSWSGAERAFSRFGPFEIELTPSLIRPTFWNTVSEFTGLGLRTFLIGIPPVAFMMALLLQARSWGDAIRSVSSFAISQSVTLFLGSLEVIHLPAAATESLISVSVIYVAAENYFLKDARHRWILTFAFGLVHGLGFAGSLGPRMVDVMERGLPIFGFGLGLALGEFAILLVAVPVLASIRRGPDEASRERRHQGLVRIGSAFLLLLGVGLLGAQFFRSS